MQKRLEMWDPRVDEIYQNTQNSQRINHHDGDDEEIEVLDFRKFRWYDVYDKEADDTFKVFCIDITDEIVCIDENGKIYEFNFDGRPIYQDGVWLLHTDSHLKPHYHKIEIESEFDLITAIPGEKMIPVTLENGQVAVIWNKDEEFDTVYGVIIAPNNWSFVTWNLEGQYFDEIPSEFDIKTVWLLKSEKLKTLN